MIKILCLSNGHGEDVIAVAILKQLQLLSNELELAALPLVGEGIAYRDSSIPIVGPVQKMPSGGFIYMDGYQLWRDLQDGLIGLTKAQYKAVRHWVNTSDSSVLILAVGDILPLLFAYLAGVDYVFVGTAKSEYHLRDEVGWLPSTPALLRLLGSVYLPPERWLMNSLRCKAVFTRDDLTAKILQKSLKQVFCLGNPMMDGILPPNSLPPKPKARVDDNITILLLPGSRLREAQQNWQEILSAVQDIVSAGKYKTLVFVAPVAGQISFECLEIYLAAFDWHCVSNEVDAPISLLGSLVYQQKNAILILTRRFCDCLMAADVAIATAGTATEQFVGTGKPAIAFPGRGPQFTSAFARKQARLLGASLILVEHPSQVKDALFSLLDNPIQLKLIEQNGLQRMGSPGAAMRIAQHIQKLL